ncbi:MAG: hypothetical protein WCO53_13510 [Deltaproteobacteria bacterium]
MMKMYPKLVSLLAGIFIWGIAASCGAAAYYNTIEQSAGLSEQIKSAAEFKVRTLDFSAINPKDLGYNTVDEWKVDSKDVPKAFADSFPILLKEAGVESKKVISIKPDESVSKGIAVDVAVKKILVKWNYFSGQPDEYVCNVSFTDAASGQKLFTAIINVNSRAGNPYAQAWGMGFSGRIQTAAYNIAWVLTKIMIQGKIDPVDY